MTLKNDLLNAIDKAIQESPRERSMRESRELLFEVRRRFGDQVASNYADCPWRPKALREMRALLDGPTKAPAPVKATVPGLLPPPPPKPAPAPAMSTATLKAVVYDTIRFELPNDFAELDEHAQRRAMLRAVWRCHAEDAVPQLTDEITAVTKGTKRFPASVGAAAAAFRREAIAKRIKKLNAHK